MIALGAKVTMLMRFKDAPPGACAGGMAAPGDKVMHASMLIGDTNVMLSDGRCQGKANFAGISLSLAAANDSEANRLFSALSDGGNPFMPLAKTFFASSFGMVTDRFGVTWMVTAE
jgi:PhnB protein